MSYRDRILPPNEPKASVSAEEFLLQAQRQAAQRQEEITVGPPMRCIEEEPRKRSNRFPILALCAVFVLGYEG